MKHMLKFENGIEFLPSGYRTSLLSQQQQQQLLIKRLTDNPEKYLRFLKVSTAVPMHIFCTHSLPTCSVVWQQEGPE